MQDGERSVRQVTQKRDVAKRNVLVALLVTMVVGASGFAAYAWHPTISPIEPPEIGSFDPALVRRGAELAAIGNCNVCHTKPGGEVFAGGLAVPTPFGTVYSTNITPDAQTGIGRWSEEAFGRSMRAGLDREGRHLYPAFPYDHFTRVTDADNRALYAFLMTRESVMARAPENDLPFPLNQRWVLAGWKLLFFREGGASLDDVVAQDPIWQRGAYLTEGLGHCGACHTPRNAFGAERGDAHFAGGEAEGWTAYALNIDSPAAIPWTEESMAIYLRQGWHERHGIARGSMAPVVGNLASVPEDDTRAIARYVVSQMGQPSAERQQRAVSALERAGGDGAGAHPASADSQTVAAPPRNKAGADIYAAACATCHEARRPLPFGGLHLSLSTGITGPTPQNLLNVVLNGLPASSGERAPIMPGFRGTLDGEQLAALVQYLRTEFSGRPAWDGVEEAVQAARERDHNRAVSSRPIVTSRSAPADLAQP
ncbi:cytochrome c [Teichococcus vastitatis]|uniref:C-type cytochrome n=1 Tax=Teichococcus vastitatis TaxID=2307076 RepID=A0ABS9W6Z5_9PROT|nr:cytochrome c [Pseudoroseomonas vastitatis]MCI0754991.1 c-type cytochrome [Pseudoroseomonas vastitatis]